MKFLFKNKFSLIIALLLVFYGSGSNIAFDLDLEMIDKFVVIGLEHISYTLAGIIIGINLGFYFLEKRNYPINRKLKIGHTITGYLALVLGVFSIKSFFDFYNAVVYGNTSDVLSFFRIMAIVVASLVFITLLLIAINWINAFKFKGKPAEKISIDSILDS